MTEVDERVSLWRSAIVLFHQFNRPPFIGPFKQAGFEYVICRDFLTSTGETREPDIVGSGPSGWAVVELTAEPKSKAAKLDSYRGIDALYLGTYGLRVHSIPPDTFAGRRTGG